MKKSIFFFGVTIIICSAYIQPPTDYRDAYVGNYRCTSNCLSISSDLSELIHNTDTATISVTKNTRDSILNISVRGLVYQLKLRNGVISSPQYRSHNQGKFFSADSISFSTKGGLAPNGCTYKGKKQ